MGEYNDIEAIVEENAKLRKSSLRIAEINERLIQIIKEMVDRPSALEAVRFLAELKEQDPPHFVHMISAILVIRDSQDVESVRLAARAMLRNLQRLEEKLDEAKGALEASEASEREQ